MIGRTVYKGDVTASEIKKAYKKAFGCSFWDWLFGGCDIKLADQTYKECSLTDLNRILVQDKTDQGLYEAEGFDCDDFAFCLMGAFHRDRETAAMPIFITWVQTEFGGHALLSFYYFGSIAMIEPQTDEIFPIPEGWRLSLLCG